MSFSKFGWNSAGKAYSLVHLCVWRVLITESVSALFIGILKFSMCLWLSCGKFMYLEIFIFWFVCSNFWLLFLFRWCALQHLFDAWFHLGLLSHFLSYLGQWCISFAYLFQKVFLFHWFLCFICLFSCFFPPLFFSCPRFFCSFCRFSTDNVSPFLPWECAPSTFSFIIFLWSQSAHPFPM